MLIGITVVILLVLSQILAHYHLANVLVSGEEVVTRRKKIWCHVCSALNWPLVFSSDIVSIGEDKYKGNIVASLFYTLCSYIVIFITWYCGGDYSGLNIFGKMCMGTMIWWFLDYLVIGLVQAIEDGTLFDP